MISELFVLPLRSSVEQVQAQLGLPLQTTSENGEDILWYESVVPDYATHYFIQAGRLERIAVNTNKRQHTVADIEAELGKPAWAVRRFAAVDDSLEQVIMVWPQQGYSVVATTMGQQSAKVIRVEQFKARSLEEYKSTLGVQYAGHEEIAMLSEEQQEPSVNVTTAITAPSVPKQAKSTVVSFDIAILLIILVAIVGAGMAMYLSTKKKPVEKQPPANS